MDVLDEKKSLVLVARIFKFFPYLYQYAWSSKFDNEKDQEYFFDIWKEQVIGLNSKATISVLTKIKNGHYQEYINFPPTPVQFKMLVKSESKILEIDRDIKMINQESKRWYERTQEEKERFIAARDLAMGKIKNILGGKFLHAKKDFLTKEKEYRCPK